MVTDPALVELAVLAQIDAKTDEDYRFSWVSRETFEQLTTEGSALHAWRFAADMLGQSFDPWQKPGPLHAQRVTIGEDWVVAFWRTWTPYRRSVVDVATEAL